MQYESAGTLICEREREEKEKLIKKLESETAIERKVLPGQMISLFVANESAFGHTGESNRLPLTKQKLN